MTLAEVKEIVQEGALAEVVDDLSEDFPQIVRYCLRKYNLYAPRIVREEITSWTGLGTTRQYSPPYPWFVTMSHEGAIADKYIWQAQPMYVYNRQIGNLKVNTIGAFQIRSVYKKTLDDITDEEDLFFDLVTARCLMASGYRRKAFNITELPFTNDGGERLSDGQTLWNATIEVLQDNIDMSIFVH